MKRNAFTLLELLVVVAIMGILGTAAVGGYRAMQRGMEERGVMQNVNQFIRSAFQRAQIDRAPVAVYFWNETIRKETDTETMIVIGRAVAVRRAGRISYVQGSYLYDEFGDLSFNQLRYDEDSEEEEPASASGSTVEGNGIYIYYMNGDRDGFQRSIISQTTKRFTLSEPMLEGGTAKIESFAYVLMDKGGVSWSTGDAYGFEFAEIQLPHNFIFGSSFQRNVTSPVTEVDVMNFEVAGNSGNGVHEGDDGTITISSLRPDASGELAVQKVGDSESPTRSLMR